MRHNIQDRPGAQGSAANLFVRIDLASRLRIGPEQIALLEAIRSTGSISAAGRVVGLSHRWAWLLVHEINQGVKAPRPSRLRQVDVAAEERLLRRLVNTS
jgi:hypothetical protein